METAPLVLAQPEKTPVLPRPAEPNLSPVLFKVVVPATVCDTSKKDCKFFYMGLSEKDYEALASNVTEMLRWKTEAEFLLNYYEGKIPPPPAH